MADLCNKFLTAKRQRVDSGELSARMWAEYHKACETDCGAFGTTRALDDLRLEEFGELRAAAKRLGSFALGKFVNSSNHFPLSYSTELIDSPVRYGEQFDKPAAKSLCLARAKRGVRLIDAPDGFSIETFCECQKLDLLSADVDDRYRACSAKRAEYASTYSRYGEHGERAMSAFDQATSNGHSLQNAELVCIWPKPALRGPTCPRVTGSRTVSGNVTTGGASVGCGQRLPPSCATTIPNG